jgi:hypothetical protein
MGRMGQYLAKLVLVLGIIAFVMGAAFIYQGISKANTVRTAMREEKVTYLLPPEEVAKGNVIDTAEEAQMVADKVKEDRHTIAATYDDLLAGGKYDPTNPKDLNYTQALNLENYLYLAVLAFGLTTVVLASGAFMVVTGIALGTTGMVLLGLTKGK